MHVRMKMWVSVVRLVEIHVASGNGLRIPVDRCSPEKHSQPIKMTWICRRFLIFGNEQFCQIC